VSPATWLCLPGLALVAVATFPVTRLTENPARADQRLTQV
jgi:hypothetical protein